MLSVSPDKRPKYLDAKLEMEKFICVKINCEQ